MAARSSGSADHGHVAGVEIDDIGAAQVRGHLVLRRHREAGVAEQADVGPGDRGTQAVEVDRLADHPGRLGDHAIEGVSDELLVHVVAEHRCGQLGVEATVGADERIAEPGGHLGGQRAEPGEDVADGQTVRGHRARHEHDATQPLGDAPGDARQRDAGERVTDQHHVVEIVRHHLVDDRIDEVGHGHPGEVGGPRAAPGQVDGADRRHRGGAGGGPSTSPRSRPRARGRRSPGVHLTADSSRPPPRPLAHRDPVWRRAG